MNIEANACGTPVVTFDTGGSPECLNKLSGCVVPCDNIDRLEKEICRIYNEKSYTKEDCISQAKKFDKNDRFKEYVELYDELNGK